MLKTFFQAKWIWSLPTQVDVLIYDQVGSEVIKSVLGKDVKVSTLARRGEWINVRILFNALKNKESLNNLILSYVVEYINYARPKLVLTFIDNNPLFYSLSPAIPRIKTAFIQNGLRSNLEYAPKPPSQSYFVDLMFVMGEVSKKMVSSHIDGRVIKIGSLKNNAYPRRILQNSKLKKSIAFVSQWYPPWSQGNSIKIDNVGITHSEFYKAESLVLDFLGNWAKDNNYELRVVGRSPKTRSQDELSFFQSLIKKPFVFVPNKGPSSSYNEIDQSEFVVHIDSTLGYEAMARGKKGAVFSIRNLPNYGFGYSEEYADIGFFWTNIATQSELKRVMDSVKDITQDGWCAHAQNYISEIMHYDPGNKIIKSIIHNELR